MVRHPSAVIGLTYLAVALMQLTVRQAVAQLGSASNPTNSASASVPVLAGRRLTNGLFQLQVTTSPGGIFRIQASNDLGKWTDVAVVTNQAGVASFLDQASAQFPSRFYRVMAEKAVAPRPEFGIRELYLIEQINRRSGSADAVNQIRVLLNEGKTDEEIIRALSAGSWPPGWTRYQIANLRQPVP